MGVRAFDPSMSVPLHLDAALVRVAKGGGAIELALGELFSRLFEGDRLIRLGWAKQVDYARERLGIAPRSMYRWMELAEGLRDKPLLRKAVQVGAVTPGKARIVMDAAVGREEPAWTAAAMHSSSRDLEARVKSAGKVPLTREFEVETMRLRMDEGQQQRLDRAFALAEQDLGYGTASWKLLEAVCEEWLGSFAAFAPEQPLADSPDECELREAHEDWIRAWSDRSGEVERQLDALGEAEDVLEDVGNDAFEIDAKIRRLLRARRTFDVPYGKLLRDVSRLRVWKSLGFRSLEEYARERLGRSARSVRERVWLEDRLHELPKLREAFRSGEISFSKALPIARTATAETVESLIEDAVSGTWQDLDRESTEEEKRRDLADGVRRLWMPEETAKTVSLAISSAVAVAKAAGESISIGEALARMGDHFVSVWEPVLKKKRRSRRKAEMEAMLRHGGLCSVPGCTLPAVDLHHLLFRSQGGPDAPWNRTPLCWWHHHQGVHAGRMRIRGRADDVMSFHFGVRPGEEPLAKWRMEESGRPRRVG